MKQFWLDLAEVTDALRIIPRIILFLAFIGYGMFSYDTYLWIKGIYTNTQNVPISVATYAGGTMAALGGILTLLVNKYFEGGRKWGD